MQSATSLSSIASITSHNSSIYGSQTILEVEDLPSAAPRCRSSIICSDDTNQSPSIRTKSKCRHLFRTCLSSSSYPLSSLIQKKLSDHTFRKQYFTKLCRNHRLLLILNDYQCKCGCHFSMKQGSFVVLYETKMESLSSWNKTGFITVISNQLICSKIPSHFVCDINVLRERVRSRPCRSNELSFDL
ncbi:unnamed protein product [Rotaria magnacalcarata]|uniref:Uncharacterized protein n=1 Tax=Rotaria magnacalcarata TaxID=392030 RepID=A0A816ZKX8_9BILA|nr:unnamed protein product [Rotaria magnacalcarata]CAF1569745.1 unnamed protein product [Rotaria magnacalcarata]CAF1620608.1 unnamed protein product [Rotaria magnacalcarata]CAF2041364.1 unnamed protein product [Rotaria magnacalcarata]CAF2045037.1 unnamed protein product [Rotaria magnacalcarata]